MFGFFKKTKNKKLYETSLPVRAGPGLGYLKSTCAPISGNCTEKKHHQQQASAKYLLLVLQASARHIVQATGGESGQLTCHAPVTFRSVELDFLVGTENPIRLLYSAAPLTPDKTKQGVPDWENGFCRLFSLFWGQCCEIKGRFYLWQHRGLDYRWTGGRGRAVNCALRGRDWLAAAAYTCSGGGTGRWSTGRTGLNTRDYVSVGCSLSGEILREIQEKKCISLISYDEGFFKCCRKICFKKMKIEV